MNSALILIDIQNDYFPGGSMTLSGSDEAALNAAKVLAHFRTKKLPVFHVQHIATRPTATFFLPGTFGAEIHQAVYPVVGEEVIVKHFPNSFRQTELLDKLNGLGVEHLVIAGMMTHMCVDATTRAAKDLGFECTIIGDACASRDQEIWGERIDAEGVHKSFLAALSYFYATVVTSNDFLSKN
jgi:nicotinamidase-related amidase